MGAGRNDPCPCGSGLKYKRCCLGKEAAGWGAFTTREREQALAALTRFADREEFDAHQVVADFYEKHYRGWPDTPLPALGGRTPRHAARLKTAPARRLLKDMETRAERQRREGRPAYDVTWMWQELGLERPE